MKGLEYKDKLNEFKGQCNTVKRLYESEVKNNKKLSQDFLDAEKAQDILMTVGLQTQEQLSFRIENLVTGALQYVVPEDYKFVMDFDSRRGGSQCDLSFELNGFKASPKNDSAGTVLDTASVALRLALWSLQQKRTSPLMILDEPGRHISVDLRGRFSEFIKEMSGKLGIQFIVISHDNNIEESADTVIEITKNKGFSSVKI